MQNYFYYELKHLSRKIIPYELKNFIISIQNSLLIFAIDCNVI